MKQLIALLGFVGFALAGPDGPPPPECFKGNKVFPDCCKITLFPADVVAKCKAANPPPTEPMTGPPKGGCCYSECLMNSTGIVVNGQFDQAAALKMIGSLNNNDATINTLVTAAITSCTTKMNEMTKSHPPPPAPPGGCGMCSGFMKGCVGKEIFLNCPANLKQSSATCDSVKALADKCPFIIDTPV